MAVSLFVYGTLLPGHLRWPMLAPLATATRRATCAGHLWDTGWGWPAAVFRETPDRVPGVVVDLDGAGRALRDLMAELDAMEGISSPPDLVSDPYERVVVAAHSDHGVEQVLAYHATRVEPTWRRIERWEGVVER